MSDNLIINCSIYIAKMCLCLLRDFLSFLPSFRLFLLYYFLLLYVVDNFTMVALLLLVWHSVLVVGFESCSCKTELPPNMRWIIYVNNQFPFLYGEGNCTTFFVEYLLLTAGTTSCVVTQPLHGNATYTVNNGHTHIHIESYSYILNQCNCSSKWLKCY